MFPVTDFLSHFMNAPHDYNQLVLVPGYVVNVHHADMAHLTPAVGPGHGIEMFLLSLFGTFPESP